MRQILVLGLALAVVGSFLIEPPEDKVVFLDVGQGDAILLQDGTQQVLIDGGPGMTVLTCLAEELPWFDRSIEVVVLTHPQQDHMEGLLHVLERYEVGLVLLPRVAHTSQLQAAWLQQILDYGVPYRFALAGQRITFEDLELTVVGPLDSAEAAAAMKADLNNASVVMRADVHGLSFLLTGDVEARAERLLVESSQSEALNADILKVGHHGSDSSTSQQLLDAVTPAAAVISVGADNRFGHPRDTVLDRLSAIPLWRTDQHGSVRYTYSRGMWLAPAL